MKTQRLILSLFFACALLAAALYLPLAPRRIFGHDMDDGDHFVQTAFFSGMGGPVTTTGYAIVASRMPGFGPLLYAEQMQMWEPGFALAGPARALPATTLRYTATFTDLTSLMFPDVTFTSTLPARATYTKNGHKVTF